MTPKLKERLEELRTEFESGKNMLAEIDAKRDNLKQTLLRISGAIQVLEEELNSGASGQETLNFDDSELSEDAATEEGVEEKASA